MVSFSFCSFARLRSTLRAFSFMGLVAGVVLLVYSQGEGVTSATWKDCMGRSALGPLFTFTTDGTEKFMKYWEDCYWESTLTLGYIGLIIGLWASFIIVLFLFGTFFGCTFFAPIINMLIRARARAINKKFDTAVVVKESSLVEGVVGLRAKGDSRNMTSVE